MADFPFVTCVCPTTAKRAHFLPHAIACFESQSYENRELLIVTEHEGHRGLGGTGRVRVVVVSGLPLGAKRNFANENARGELIAHFDDDDWSAPGRLAAQVERLRVSGLVATGYSRLKFTDGKSWWRYTDAAWPLGTSLCYSRAWWKANPFDGNTQVGSDTKLIHRLQNQKQVDVVECGDMMFARIHADNTNQRAYVPPTFQPAEAVCFA